MKTVPGTKQGRLHWNASSILVSLTIVTLTLCIKQDTPVASPSVYEKTINKTVSTSNNVTGAHPSSSIYTENHFWLPRQLQATRYRFPRSRQESSAETTTRSDRPIIVVGILSAAATPERREWVRNTWLHNQTTSAFFLVGGNWTDELATEFEQYRDLLWVDTPEGYRRLTEKVAGFCAVIAQELDPSSYDYVMKTDDDSYVVLDDMIDQILVPDHKKKLTANVTTQQQPHYLYTGGGCEQSIVKRDPANKWYVSEEDFALERYPPYALGNGYFLSRDLVSCVVRQNYLLVDPNTMTSQEAHERQLLPGMFPVEDAFLGLLVQNCNGSSCLQDDRRFKNQLPRPIVRRGKLEEWLKSITNTKSPPLIHGIKTQGEMERFHYERCCAPIYGNTTLSICGLVQCGVADKKKNLLRQAH